MEHPSTLDLLFRRFNGRLILSLDDLSSVSGIALRTIYGRTHRLRQGKEVDLPKLNQEGKNIQIHICDLADWIDTRSGRKQNSQKGRPTKQREIQNRKTKAD